MSSSDRVKLSAIPETTYGETPAAGSFLALSFIDESLSGDPVVTESKAMRSDRQKSGQIVTGLELSGGYNFELSNEPSIEQLVEHAMMSDVVAESVHTGTLLISGGGTILSTSSSFVGSGFENGDMIVLENFTNPENNTVVIATNVTSGACDIVGEGLVDGGGTGTTATRPAYHNVGSEDKSMSICKEFLDLTDTDTRSLTYRGERVSEFSLNFTFGDIVNGSVSFAGNGYDQPTAPITKSRTVTATSSLLPIDAGNGFGWLLVDNTNVDICVESLSLTLNNNLQPANCIGRLAPRDQQPGSVGITFSSSMHLGINSWDLLMASKLSQLPLSIAFFSRDVGTLNGYGVVLDRVQVSFPDPSAGGQDTTVMLEATGTASYDVASGNTMRIYIL